MIEILHYLKDPKPWKLWDLGFRVMGNVTLNYGNYRIFLILGNAGFLPSTVVGLV